MATIGLDKLFYAPITEAANGDETYGTPVQLAKAISADLSVELAEATLYADDGASEVVKELSLQLSQVSQSTETKSSSQRARTRPYPLRSDSAQNAQTGNTGISGCTA